MAFWGVEVAPDKPFVHTPSSQGALRISQATLGDGIATERSVVQCCVGDRSVLLCSLLPNRVECCFLDLHFDEDDTVTFKVIGPRSVHLTGYFVGVSMHGGLGDELSDSDYEENWEDEDWETGSEESGSISTEEEYGSGFIDYDDIEMSPSPKHNSGVVIEEIIEDEKTANGNINAERLEDKHLDDSDEGNVGSRGQIIAKHDISPMLESEDEDGFPISLHSKDGGKNIYGDQKLILNIDRKRKLNDVVDKDSDRKRKVGAVNNEKSKKKKKEKLTSSKSLESDFGTPSDKNRRPTEEQNNDADDKMAGAQSFQGESENVDQEDHPCEMVLIKNSRELKKKKKEEVKREETSEMKDNSLIEKSGEGDSTNIIEATNNVVLANTENSDKEPLDEIGQNGPSAEKDDISFSNPSATPDYTDKLKRKKKKKKRTKDRNPLDHKNKSAGILGKDGCDKSQRMEVNKSEVLKSQEKMDGDQPAGELSHNMNSKGCAGSPVVLCEDRKKKNKKMLENGSALDKELELRNEVPRKPRTFANGLVIEELLMGQPDGKRASPGKTVFVHYIGKLRNGKIFDSNIGRKPFKFRLGVGQVIKGWDVGVDGMRIGDKRRLTVPPSMGYGEKGAGGVIPGNAWLVFDVELVDAK